MFKGEPMITEILILIYIINICVQITDANKTNSLVSIEFPIKETPTTSNNKIYTKTSAFLGFTSSILLSILLYYLLSALNWFNFEQLKDFLKHLITSNKEDTEMNQNNTESEPTELIYKNTINIVILILFLILIVIMFWNNQDEEYVSNKSKSRDSKNRSTIKGNKSTNLKSKYKKCKSNLFLHKNTIHSKDVTKDSIFAKSNFKR